MSKYFEVSGYWKDDKQKFNNLVFKEFDDYIEGEDDMVDEFGWSENDLKDALNKTDGILDFVITSYKEI